MFLRVGETSQKKKKPGKVNFVLSTVSSMCQQKYKKNYGVVQHHLLGDSIIHCKCMYGWLYWLHFTAGILKMIFLYSFRGVGAMEIVAMDMKVRSIVF